MMDASSAADARLIAIGGEGACVAYLSCLATATSGVRVTLCDGTRTWSGELVARDLRHPSGTSPDDFRKKLVEGLRSGPSDALAIGPRHVPSRGATDVDARLIPWFWKQLR